MSEKDIVVGSTNLFPTGPQAKVVPHYLVKLLPDSDSKNKKYKMFIVVEQFIPNPDFIHVKGFFTDATEDDIVLRYRDIVAGFQSVDKLEIWIPWHTIHSVRSLIFKTANK